MNLISLEPITCTFNNILQYANLVQLTKSLENVFALKLSNQCQVVRDSSLRCPWDKDGEMILVGRIVDMTWLGQGALTKWRPDDSRVALGAEETLKTNSKSFRICNASGNMAIRVVSSKRFVLLKLPLVDEARDGQVKEIISTTSKKYYNVCSPW